MPTNNQTVVRTNRDTLYSTAVFDLDASPISYPARKNDSCRCSCSTKINMPETVYAPGTFTYTRDKGGARYVMFRISNVHGSE
ncbi:hypothetical protein B2M20_10880 [Nitrobacter vulgaris]|uniref:DUF1254 domain-containing protein n=2 Tax=Nitrobacter vulgaris TaxID=29421 RepID=A0A1V4HYS3_NITVU|nr:hypothetical protein B2M20_10880 [Nitrobacter vulgaris]